MEKNGNGRPQNGWKKGKPAHSRKKKQKSHKKKEKKGEKGREDRLDAVIYQALIFFG